MTVLSSLLVRCRPRWESLILIVKLAYAATDAGIAWYSSPDESTAHAIRASLLAAATINTLRGALGSRAVNHEPIAIRSRFDRKTTARAPWMRTAQVFITALADSVELRLAASRVLFRHQPHPSGKLPPLRKAALLPIQQADGSSVPKSGPMPGICLSRGHAASLDAIFSGTSIVHSRRSEAPDPPLVPQQGQQVPHARGVRFSSNKHPWNVLAQLGWALGEHQTAL